MTRRDFAKLGSLSLAARLAPVLAAQTAQKKTGYAVIGLGRIAGHFMPAAGMTANSQITALVSGHPDKARTIAAQYNIPATSIYNYENFDEIAHNPAVDAVYIALPNSMHAEYTIRAAKAGKHVLCEKPMATNVADCEKMITACKAANVKLMIAYRCHYEPTNLKAIEIIRSGALGQVQAIESPFGFNIARGEWRLSKTMAGGGPLFDVGIYSLNACRYLTGEEPEQPQESKICSTCSSAGSRIRYPIRRRQSRRKARIRDADDDLLLDERRAFAAPASGCFRQHSHSSTAQPG
jgi:predicted dehydrogenase